VRILAHDPYVAQSAAPQGVTMVDMPTLLSQSDLISIHVTLTDHTRHMIGAEELRQMKPNAYLINTSRGGAIDERALITALRSGQLGGAALDVFEHEPLPADSPLRTLDNVRVISHIVGQVNEMHASFVNAALENITRMLRNEAPLYVRNPEVLPAWQKRLVRLDGGNATAS
jgi:D-3-phosphoglycerate dehydrogenase